jgi:hypothetical protein
LPLHLIINVILSSVLLISPFAVPWTSQSKKTVEYPTVRRSVAVFSVPEITKADVEYLIRSTTDHPIYKLRCHHNDFEDINFDYSGDFECRLNSVSEHDQFSTLLTEDPRQSRDWESRGRFFASELRPPCSRIPHFGATRDFRLRGMTLTLEVINPQFDNTKSLKSLTLRVAVNPDPSALGRIAEAVPVPAHGIPKNCQLERNFVGNTSR